MASLRGLVGSSGPRHVNSRCFEGFLLSVALLRVHAGLTGKGEKETMITFIASVAVI